MPELDLTLAWNFATALLIGALVGIERERHKQRQEHPEIAGLRTFIRGPVRRAERLCQQGPRDALDADDRPRSITAAILTGYVLGARMNPGGLGLTTELAAVATFLLGAIAALGHRELAIAHRRDRRRARLQAAAARLRRPARQRRCLRRLRLLIATFIILPILPNATIDPWDALNPQSLWLLVLLIAGLSLVGYVLTRLLGAHRGIPLTGLSGGLVSSTAVTLSFARQSRELQYAAANSAIASGILLAWTVSFVRVLVEVLVVNRALLPSLLPAMIPMTVVCAAFAAWHQRRAGQEVQAQDVPLRNPFSLTSAIKFAALFAAVLLVVKLAQAHAPETGLYYVAALAGTTDVDAITLSMAQYARTGNPDVASHAVTIAVLSNTIIKTGMVTALGTPALRGSVLVATFGILVAGVGAILLT